MHGLFSWNSACHTLLEILGGSDPANMVEFQRRFAAPVKAGNKLVTEAWRIGNMQDDWEEVRFIVKIEGGNIVLSNGRALMKCKAVRSQL